MAFRPSQGQNITSGGQAEVVGVREDGDRVDDVVALKGKLEEVPAHEVDETLELINGHNRAVVPHAGHGRVLVVVLGSWKNRRVSTQKQRVSGRTHS